MDFDKRVTTTTNAHPLDDYKTLSAKASSLQPVLKKALKQKVVGEIALTNFDKDGIKQAIYGILEARKKSKLAVFNGTKSVANATSFVNDILLNPQKYAGGQTEIPYEFKLIYDGACVKTLITISTICTSFLESEMVRLAVPIPTSTTLDDFISNEPLNGTYFEFTTTPPARGFQFPENGGYIISNIKKIKTKHSTDLITKLEEFANHVREGEKPEKTDWVGAVKGATRIAKGLSFGVPTAG